MHNNRDQINPIWEYIFHRINDKLKNLQKKYAMKAATDLNKKEIQNRLHFSTKVEVTSVKKALRKLILSPEPHAVTALCGNTNNVSTSFSSNTVDLVNYNNDSTSTSSTTTRSVSGSL